MALISLSALEHGAFVFAGLLIYVMVARIGQQRRAPSVAFAWVVSIAAFPYLGLPLFLIFGTRKFVRPAPRPQPAQAPPSPGVPAWPARLLGGLGVPPPVRNTGILFFEDAPGAFDGLLALCAGATRRLDIGTFLLGNDEVGAQVADDLLKASARGVATRLLIDAVGSRRTPRSLLQRLRSGGVEVRSFMPLLHNPTRGRSNLRNHRKVALADGARLWSGGRNLAAEYFVGKDGDPAWIDISFVVEGLAAAQAQAQFDADWRRAGGRVGAQTPRTLAYEPAAGTWAQWVACGPDHADDTVHALLMAAAFQAQERILAVTPYFVPDDGLLEAWCLACRRGVRVRLVLPIRSNHRLADWARGRSLRSLIDAGGEVWLTPTMVHAKAVVVDDQLALCGSVNLDSRSLFLNFEAMMAFYADADIAWLAHWIEQLAARSQPCAPVRPGFWRDVGEGVVRAVGFQL